MAIVVSILAASLDELARAARAEAGHADVIELRLDAFRASTIDERALAELVRSFGKPVIAAVHGPEAFGGIGAVGTFAGDARERCELLRAAARAGAAFVDVDARFASELGPASELGGARRIVSHHEKGATPDVVTLFKTVDACAAREDLVKVVTHAACAEDGLRVLATLAKSRRERVAFCSGERGSFTRVLAPLAGSPFTYAAPSSAADATAPGQMRADELRALLPASGSRATRWYAVVGFPIAHSWSPRVHTAAIRAAKADAAYVACAPDHFGRFFELARALPFAGFSVTGPFKTLAARAADERDAATEAIGAANTLVLRDGRWSASNTDAPAIEGSIAAALAPRTVRGSSALVVGAGGAARAAAWALAAAGADVQVFARDPKQAETLARELGVRAIDSRGAASRSFDAIVHATPVGSRSALALDAAAAFPTEWIAPGTVVLDAVYRPRTTTLVWDARARGARVVTGDEWFLRQALAQAELFLGAHDAVEPAMRAELDRALAEDEA